MRVLMFGWEFPPHISGGLGTACYELTRALRRRHVEVLFVVPHAHTSAGTRHPSLVSADRFSPPARPRAARGFELRLIESALRPYMSPETYRHAVWSRPEPSPTAAAPGTAPAVAAPPTPTPYGDDLFAEVLRYSRVAETLAQSESFDLIHVHDWMAIPAGLAARRISRKPLVVHVHATEFDRSPDGGNAAIREIERAGMQAAERVVTVSHYSRNLILNRYGIRPEKVLVVHNAVSRRTAGPVYHVRRRSAQKLVLFLGRLTYQKGPDYFIEAAAKVLKVLPGVLFVMAGTGDLLPSLVRRVARLRIGDRFHFTGFLEGEWVERTYAMSDLYVMPSVSEPFGIAPLEAMLCDVPVIVSTHSGVAEVLTHALKVDFWNTDELANQMIAALTHTALTAELRRNAREEVRQLTWNTAAESLLALYRQLAPHARS